MPKPPEEKLKLRSPAPQHDPVFIWPTPNTADLLFYVEKNGDLPKNKDFTYGDLYWDSTKYPDHRLIHVTEQTPDKWSRWYYASDRINQDAYNYHEKGGEELVRTYLSRRGIAPAFTIPAGGSSATGFSGYGFVGVSYESPGQPLDGLYQIIRLHYSQKESIDYEYNDRLMRLVKVTRTIVAKGTTPASPVAGAIEEIRNGNIYHDVKVRTELHGATLPWDLPDIPTFASYSLPPKLNSITLIGAWAYADSTQAAQSYSEDYYFKYDLTEARPGPYPATIERIVTDDPSAYLGAISITPFPSPKRETIGVVGAWFYASPKGNQTNAIAREEVLPTSYHDELTITVDMMGDGVEDGATWRRPPDPIDATPGFTGDFTGEYYIDAKAVELPLGLYEVQLTKINLGGGVYV